MWGRVDTRRRGLPVLVVAVAALLAVPAAAADEIDWMYDPDSVVEIELGGLSEAELDELEADPSEEVRGTFELKADGVTKAALDDVGIRLKGGLGSFRPVKTGKAAFKIRFDKFVKGQLFFGLKRLTLNNMVQDPSMVHETLTYEIFRALGLPASRTGYAAVRLNGEFYGVYLNIETLDKIFLARHFASTRHLYEADSAGVDVRVGEEGTFEVDEGSEEDVSDLEALIAAANDLEGDWSDGMAAVADLTEMTRVWAVERYAGHWDGYAGIYAPPLPSGDFFRPNNYYLHSLDSGVFEMLPWGTDQTWEIGIEFDEPAGGLLFNNCLADESCAALYGQALQEVQVAVPALELAGRTLCTAELLKPWQQMESPPRREYEAEEIAAGVAETHALVADRPEELADFLGADAPEGPIDEELCTTDEDPGQPQQPQVQPIIVSAPESPRAATVKFGSTRLVGAFVVTSLQVGGPGSAGQQVSSRIDGRRVSLCGDRGSRTSGGGMTLRCKLPKKALNALESGPLRLKVRVGFDPDIGTSRAVIRRLTVPASE